VLDDYNTFEVILIIMQKCRTQHVLILRNIKSHVDAYIKGIEGSFWPFSRLQKKNEFNLTYIKGGPD
jgi:hypothetical protein